MTTWPKVEKAVPVSTTTRPVTHTQEVEVNSASKKPTLTPVAEAMGSVRSRRAHQDDEGKPQHHHAE